MGFPRAPHKRVSGTLKLYVAPPISEEVGEKQPLSEVEDLSSQIMFSLPRGFTMDKDLSEVIKRQEKGALNRLGELRKKARGCCHSKVDVIVVDRAQEIVERACGVLQDRAHSLPSLVLGHQQDTSITIDFTVRDRHLAIIVYRSRIAFGRYFEGTLIEESEVSKLSPPVMGGLSWVAEG